ncbi:MAG: ABC transporter ATP-binding protein [Gemmataceae bacterium]
MAAGKRVLLGDGLVHTFGKGSAQTVALDDVSLHLNSGEVVLLMGPSGSGKSTLLAVLSGLLRPEAGRVRILDQDLWRMSDRERKRFRLHHFGFIFQGFNLFPALTARQQLEIVMRWGKHVSAREARQQADLLLATLNLSAKAKLRPCEMSGGEKQRVAIGRALIKEPAICFADEPTSALDWAHGKQVVELFCEAARARHTAVLIVSHDARLIPYADRVLHMEDGHLSCMGQGEPLLSRKVV